MLGANPWIPRRTRLRGRTVGGSTWTVSDHANEGKMTNMPEHQRCTRRHAGLFPPSSHEVV